MKTIAVFAVLFVAWAGFGMHGTANARVTLMLGDNPLPDEQNVPDFSRTRAMVTGATRQSHTEAVSLALLGVALIGAGLTTRLRKAV